MRSWLLLLIFSLCFSLQSYSGNKVDSLSALLKKAAIDDTVKIKLLVDLSREFLYQNDYSRSFELAEQARKLSIRREFLTGEIAALSSLSTIFFNQSNYLKAFEYYKKVLSLSEKAGYKKGIAMSTKGMGNIFARQNELDKALEHLQRALEIEREIGDKTGMAYSLNNIGNIQSIKKKYHEALKNQIKGMKLRESANDLRGLSISYNDIAVTYESMDRLDSALYFYQQALRVAESMNNNYIIAAACTNMGGIYLNLKHYPKGIQFLLKAEKYALEIKFMEALKDIYEKLSDAYYQTKEYEKSILNYKMFVATKDSIESQTVSKKLMQAQLSLELKQKEKLAKEEKQKLEAIHKAELDKKQVERNALFGGLGLLLVLAAVSFKAFKQKQKANQLLTEQKVIIEGKNKSILDSINYGKRIQEAIFPEVEEIRPFFKDFFLFFKPRDIVSGDFYYFYESKDCYILAVADCTGHGVPGAFMSLIGNDLLNQIILEKGICDPAKILSMLHDGIRVALKQDKPNKEKDGMDVALCSISKDLTHLKFAGALRDLWVKRKGAAELEIVPGDKKSIGGVKSDITKTFTTKEFFLQPGDTFYLYTDGFADQFGGPEGKKFMNKHLKNLIFSTCGASLTAQGEELERTFQTWKTEFPQVDDVTIMGIRV